jgi:hypothetical protein
MIARAILVDILTAVRVIDQTRQFVNQARAILENLQADSPVRARRQSLVDGADPGQARVLAFLRRFPASTPFV